MIFQMSIAINIEGQQVEAVIDFDTGIIGFTEIINGSAKEYIFRDCPPAYKQALFQTLEPIALAKSLHNMRICRKGRAGTLLDEL